MLEGAYYTFLGSKILGDEVDFLLYRLQKEIFTEITIWLTQAMKKKKTQALVRLGFGKNLDQTKMKKNGHKIAQKLKILKNKRIHCFSERKAAHFEVLHDNVCHN